MGEEKFRNEQNKSGNLGLIDLKKDHNYCRIPAHYNDLGDRLGISCSERERVEIEEGEGGDAY